MIVVSIVLWVAVGLQVGLQDSESIVIHTSGPYVRGGGECPGVHTIKLIIIHDSVNRTHALLGAHV